MDISHKKDITYHLGNLFLGEHRGVVISRDILNWLLLAMFN